MPITFEDILLALEFVASGHPGSNEATPCRRTGKIFYRSDLAGIDEFRDELGDDLEEDGNYIAIPDKREFGLGKPLALDFAREFLPDDFDDVRYMFSKRGAYPKFKALLIRPHDPWYAFEEKATNQALRDWCEAKSIDVSD